MDHLDDYECYDQLLYEPMKRIGWSVDTISWRKEKVNWDAYEVVIIRSPWDYQKEPDRFLEVLEEIEKSSARLENSLDLVQWNIDKRYLGDLAEKGTRIVPTLWLDSFRADDYDKLFKKLTANEMVIKPVISAGAEHTYRLKPDADASFLTKLEKEYEHRPAMVQPFMPNIVTEGEFSLLFFGGTYSHTVLKTPARHDFRVQEEFGSRLRNVTPEPELMEHAKQVLSNLDDTPLFARVDSVRTDDHDFALMELELIEPSLYFNMDPDSPARFSKIFAERFNS